MSPFYHREALRSPPLHLSGTQAVRDWVHVRRSAPGVLLLSVDKFGRLWEVQMADQSVLTVLRKRARIENL
ncbi:MAG: hypothetical protein KME08_09390 [Aphanothece sp. CMT-3BRIN-NPC111]|nr:hypothetical protein [Aphanothece sp. CMT-3BRIN-NPC111]